MDSRQSDPGDDWFAGLVGAPEAGAISESVVWSLHYALFETARLDRELEWSNEIFAGQATYHCFFTTCSAMIESRLPQARVHRPTDQVGTAFTIELGDVLVYPFHHGRTNAESWNGFPVPTEQEIWRRLSVQAPPWQPAMDLGLPGVIGVADDLPTIVVIAWVGNRTDGLTRAFAGLPYVLGGRVFWEGGRVADLDLTPGQAEYAPPPAAVQPADDR